MAENMKYDASTAHTKQQQHAQSCVDTFGPSSCVRFLSGLRLSWIRPVGGGSLGP